jgi:Flp pilus assembly protein TadG
MGTKKQCKRWVSLLKWPCLANRGQALVEFTLIFILLLVVAWIPTDFGLGLYTAHLAQNASRDGARIAAADPTVTTQTGSCALAACYALSPNSVRHRTALRMSSAFMPDISVALAVIPGALNACNDQVQVTVSGTYNYFFYRLLGWFGVNVPASRSITRATSMRWEHQC